MITDVLSILAEEVTPSSVDVSSIVLKNELNPNLWEITKEGSHVLPDNIRENLIHIGKQFFNYINQSLDRLELKDIVFTGSMCNYNWTESSDIDVHIIVNYSDISSDHDLVFDYLMDKYSIWKKKNNITLHGYQVECYAEDSTVEPKEGVGIFSLCRNKWIIEPSKEDISIDFDCIKIKVAKIINYIEKFYSDKEAMTKIMDYIYKLRNSGLAEDGEFSQENLVFKILRRNGTLDYLKKITNY